MNIGDCSAYDRITFDGEGNEVEYEIMGITVSDHMPNGRYYDLWDLNNERNIDNYYASIDTQVKIARPLPIPTQDEINQARKALCELTA